MTDIMSKVDQYILDILTDVSRQFGGRRISATTDATARAALQSAIEALLGEVERLKGALAAKAKGYEVRKAERDALQAKLDAAHAVLDSDDSKIVRNAADGYPEGREPRELALSERVEALCTYATDWKRWCEEVQAELDELQRQEPVGFVAPHELKDLKEGFPITVVLFSSHKRTSPLYAAPKALEPVKEDETAWLAEYDGKWLSNMTGNPSHVECVQYLCIEPISGEFGRVKTSATSDVAKAIRFSRKEDAELAIKLHVNEPIHYAQNSYAKHWSANEHMWPSAPTE